MGIAVVPRQWRVVARIVFALVLVLWEVDAVRAQPPADVAIELTADVRDTASWLSLHDEILSTPRDTPKTLVVTVPAKTGGRRAITVTSPKSAAHFTMAGGPSSVRVSLTGKVSGVNALRALTPFQQAVLDIQSGLVENDIVFWYGVFGVTGRLVEMKVISP